MNDQGEFELDRAKSKNDIAENSFTLGYETHNNSTSQVKSSQVKSIMVVFIRVIMSQNFTYHKAGNISIVQTGVNSTRYLGQTRVCSNKNLT